MSLTSINTQEAKSWQVKPSVRNQIRNGCTVVTKKMWMDITKYINKQIENTIEIKI